MISVVKRSCITKCSSSSSSSSLSSLSSSSPFYIGPISLSLKSSANLLYFTFFFFFICHHFHFIPTFFFFFSSLFHFLQFFFSFQHSLFTFRTKRTYADLFPFYVPIISAFFTTFILDLTNLNRFLFFQLSSHFILASSPRSSNI